MSGTVSGLNSAATSSVAARLRLKLNDPAGPGDDDSMAGLTGTQTRIGVVPPADQLHTVAAGTIAGTSLTQVLYLQETGDTAPISVNDIHQGQIGDCFLLSSIGEVALWHPSAISSMIHANADGTETVTLYLAANGSLPTFGTTSFRPTTVTVTNTFPANVVNNGASQDVLNGQKEIWVQVLEKAVATLCGGYNAIANGGYPFFSMEELTGQPATWMSPSSLTLQQLQNDIAAGDLITMDTKSSGSLPYSLVNSHAYMFESVTVVNGTPMVRLGNPWGCNQPADIPFSQLAAGIAEVDVGQFVNSNLITGGPGNDTTTLSAIVNNASIDLGAGSDKLTFANGTNSASVANVETIVGGTGSDTVVLTTAAAGDSIDLGGSSDALTFGNFANSATVANTETITGGAGNDIITLGTALTGTMRVDLGGGVNKLVLASTGNSGSVSNVGTLIGGSGNDSITLATAALNDSIDLGGGNDVLRLANTTNQVTVGNVETIQGGSGNDTIVLTGSAAAMVSGGGGMNFITGNTGADTFVLDQNSSTSCTRLMNFNPALGDKLALDTTGSAVMPGNAYDLGGATLSSRDLIAVANAKALHTTVLNNGGKGGFVYEQDTGQLFYSSNGLYAASINPIGVITTNGVMPWAFNANSIVQV